MNRTMIVIISTAVTALICIVIFVLLVWRCMKKLKGEILIHIYQTLFFFLLDMIDKDVTVNIFFLY